MVYYGLSEFLRFPRQIGKKTIAQSRNLRSVAPAQVIVRSRSSGDETTLLFQFILLAKHNIQTKRMTIQKHKLILRANVTFSSAGQKTEKKKTDYSR